MEPVFIRIIFFISPRTPLIKTVILSSTVFTTAVHPNHHSFIDRFYNSFQRNMFPWAVANPDSDTILTDHGESHKRSRSNGRELARSCNHANKQAEGPRPPGRARRRELVARWISASTFQNMFFVCQHVESNVYSTNCKRI